MNYYDNMYINEYWKFDVYNNVVSKLKPIGMTKIGFKTERNKKYNILNRVHRDLSDNYNYIYNKTQFLKSLTKTYLSVLKIELESYHSIRLFEFVNKIYLKFKQNNVSSFYKKLEYISLIAIFYYCKSVFIYINSTDFKKTFNVYKNSQFNKMVFYFLKFFPNFKLLFFSSDFRKKYIILSLKNYVNLNHALDFLKSFYNKLSYLNNNTIVLLIIQLLYNVDYINNKSKTEIFSEYNQNTKSFINRIFKNQELKKEILNWLNKKIF